VSRPGQPPQGRWFTQGLPSRGNTPQTQSVIGFLQPVAYGARSTIHIGVILILIADYRDFKLRNMDGKVKINPPRLGHDVTAGGPGLTRAPQPAEQRGPRSRLLCRIAVSKSSFRRSRNHGDRSYPNRVSHPAAIGGKRSPVTVRIARSSGPGPARIVGTRPFRCIHPIGCIRRACACGGKLLISRPLPNHRTTVQTVLTKTLPGPKKPSPIPQIVRIMPIVRRICLIPGGQNRIQRVAGLDG